MKAESLVHSQVVFGQARSMSTTVSFFISYLEIHPINPLQIIESKATRSLCGFILNNTAVQLYTAYILEKYSSTPLISMCLLLRKRVL